MARVDLTPRQALGPYPTLQPAAGSATLTFVGNATAGDGVAFPASGGKQLLLVRNDNAGAQTVTIESIADSHGRVGEITAYSLAAAAQAVFGSFEMDGWRQADGKIYAKGSHADVKFAVVNL